MGLATTFFLLAFGAQIGLWILQLIKRVIRRRGETRFPPIERILRKRLGKAWEQDEPWAECFDSIDDDL